MKKDNFWQKVIGYVQDEEDFSNTYSDNYNFEQYSNTDGGGFRYDEIQESVEQTETINSGPLLQELPVDVYEDEDNIIVETFIPGMPLDELNIELSREEITIQGTREQAYRTNNYFLQELSWGEFERTIKLPEEVDIDNAKAKEISGVLKIILPKLNKTRKTKLRIQTVK